MNMQTMNEAKRFIDGEIEGCRVDEVNTWEIIKSVGASIEDEVKYLSPTNIARLCLDEANAILHYDIPDLDEPEGAFFKDAMAAVLNAYLNDYLAEQVAELDD